MQGKWTNITLLATAALLAMALWFSASAVVPQLTAEWHLSSGQQSWMTMSVQIGFVAGALASSVLNLADRVPIARLIAISSLLAGIFNLAIPILNVGPDAALAFRFLTGAALAGVYPPGMKLTATWCKADLGLGVGLLVGALTVGSGMPHLLNAVPLIGSGGMPPWRSVLIATSIQAAIAAGISGFLLKPGPFLRQSAPFDWKFAGKILAHRPTRLANFGYLGHMWELYAMWVWVPIFLLDSFGAAHMSVRGARLAAFAVFVTGAAGCVAAGLLADRLGRTTVASVSMIVSGSCALISGLFFASPLLLTAVCIIWGFAVVADSAQFSAAISELTDPRYVGTALTLQTSLGFLLTLFTIRLIPVLTSSIGWGKAFAVLAIGPAFGVWSMLTLRRLPEAARMASGNR